MILEVSTAIFSHFAPYGTPAYWNSLSIIRYYKKYIHKTEQFLSRIKLHKHPHLRCLWETS
jgi:hypothetical protein